MELDWRVSKHKASQADCSHWMHRFWTVDSLPSIITVAPCTIMRLATLPGCRDNILNRTSIIGWTLVSVAGEGCGWYQGESWFIIESPEVGSMGIPVLGCGCWFQSLTINISLSSKVVLLHIVSEIWLERFHVTTELQTNHPTSYHKITTRVPVAHN